MRIECPACAATYEVPDHLLAPRSPAARPVRCLRCGHQWHPVAPAPAAEPSAPPPLHRPEPRLTRPVLPPLPEPPQPSAPPPPLPVPAGGGRAMPLLAWGMSLLLLLLLAFLLLRNRDAVMAAWPPATRLFAVLGLG